MWRGSSFCLFLALFTVSHGVGSEQNIINDLYASTNGGSWNANLGWSTGSGLCGTSYYGVVCSAGKVISIDLRSNNLQNTIPSSISELIALTSLRLSSNLLSGTLVSHFTSLTNLAVFDVASNMISGTLPSFSHTALTRLLAGNNIMFSSLPSSLSLCSNLVELSVPSNSLIGTIPAGLLTLPFLSIANLCSNMFSGTVPTSAITTLSSQLCLANNRIDGVYCGASTCTSCAAGTYSFTNGIANSPSSCTSCSASSYSSSVGATSCTQCPGGYSSAGAATSITACMRIDPVQGSYKGGFPITISSAGTIGSGSDISTAFFQSTLTTVVAQTASSVTVLGPALAVGTYTVFFASTSRGTFNFNSFTAVAPVITSSSPSSGPRTTGGLVTIVGTNLGNGTDITLVQIKDVTASALYAQTSTSITVRTGVYTGVYQTYTASVSINNPFAWFRLGGTTSPAQNARGGVTGVYNGAVTYSQLGAIVADSDTAVRFNAASQTYLSIPYTTNINPTTDWTFEVWAKPVSAAFGVVVSNRDITANTRRSGWYVSWDGANFVVGAGRGCWGSCPFVEIVDPVARSLNQWYHVAASYSGSQLRMYVNGGFVDSASLSYTPNLQFRILVGAGANEGSAPYQSHFDGVIDEVILYSDALSGTTIDRHYRHGIRPDVFISSITFGDAVLRGSRYTYNLDPTVTGISPNNGIVNGQTFTITGSDLGSGSDITAVFIGTASCTIGSQSATGVTVTGSAVPLEGTLSVRTFSTSNGESILSNGFFHWARATLSTSSASVSIVEGLSQTVTFTISATVFSVPSTVTLPYSLVGANCAEFAVSGGGSLSYTSSNWNVPRSLVITTSHDFEMRSSVQCTLHFGSSTSNEAQFSGVVYDVTLSKINTDFAGVLLGATYGLYPFGSAYAMVEDTVASVQVSLTSKPLSTVTVFATVSNMVKVTSNTTFLTFTASNWNITQRFYIATPVDNVADGLQWVDVVETSSSTDANYANIVRHVALLVIDVDGASAFQLVPNFANVTEGAAPLSVYIVLTKSILSPVTVTVSVALPQVTASPPVLTVAPTNLYQPLEVQLSSVRNFVVTGRELLAVTFRALSSAVDQTLVLNTWHVDVDNAYVNASRSLLLVNETGTTDWFMFQPTSQPIQPLVFSISSSDAANCVQVAPSSATFTSGTWLNPVVVNVFGVRNSNHSVYNQTCYVMMRVTSGDASYSDVLVTMPVLNVDIRWPRVVSVAPLVVPMLGRRIAVQAYDPLPNVDIVVAGALCQNISFGSNWTMQCDTTPVNLTRDSYQNVSVWNPDGGNQLLVDALFFTDDCPVEGLYGRGVNCFPCPSYADCPGGYRMWPKPGWWTENEFSLIIGPCANPSACLGGRDSVCAPGYRGEYCSSCADGYWRADDITCEACGSAASIGALLFAQFAFVVLFMVGALFLTTEALGDATFVMNSLRALWIVTADLTGLPSLVSSILSALSLLAADLNFSQPGCSGVSTFLQLWAINIMVLLGGLLVLSILLYIQFRVAVRHVYHDLSKRHEMVVMRAKFDVHVTRVLFTYAMMIFAVLFTKAFQGVDCYQLDGVMRLGADLTQVCFDAGHSVVFVFSLVLIVVTFAVPIGIPLLCSKFHAGGQVNAFVRGLVMASTDEFVGPTALFANSYLIFGDILLSLVSTFVRDDNWRATWQIICLALMWLFVAVMRPFNSWWKALGVLILYTASILAVIHPIFTDTAAIAVAWVLIVLMLLFAALATTVLICHFRHKRQRVGDSQALAKLVKEDGDLDAQVPTSRMGAWDDDVIHKVVQLERRIESVETAREEIREEIRQERLASETLRLEQEALERAMAAKYAADEAARKAAEEDAAAEAARLAALAAAAAAAQPQAAHEESDEDEEPVVRMMRRMSQLPDHVLKEVVHDRLLSEQPSEETVALMPQDLLTRHMSRRGSLAPSAELLSSRRASLAAAPEPMPAMRRSSLAPIALVPLPRRPSTLDPGDLNTTLSVLPAVGQPNSERRGSMSRLSLFRETSAAAVSNVMFSADEAVTADRRGSLSRPGSAAAVRRASVAVVADPLRRVSVVAPERRGSNAAASEDLRTPSPNRRVSFAASRFGV